MQLGGEPVGRWGLAVLALTGVFGLVLAIHGWSGRAAGVAPSLAGGGLGTSSAAPNETASSSPSPRAATSPAGAAAPSAAASPGAGGSPSRGPLLRSEPYANVAYRIWPGPVDSTASQALTGLIVSVHKRGSGLAVTAGVRGQGAATTHLYPGGVRVYVLEASLGDDSGSLDYNLGDDGLVVTDAQGRIIR